MNASILVIKQNLAGEETWRYTGRIFERGADWVRLEAFFDRDDRDLHGMCLKRGDRFVESFFSRHWYNFFEIHDRDSDALKGWYCNVCRPAQIEPGRVSYIDLALDLLVFPDGRQLVLDEDEFAALGLDAEDTRQARRALDQLQARFAAAVKG